MGKTVPHGHRPRKTLRFGGKKGWGGGPKKTYLGLTEKWTAMGKGCKRVRGERKWKGERGWRTGERGEELKLRQRGNVEETY